MKYYVDLDLSDTKIIGTVEQVPVSEVGPTPSLPDAAYPTQTGVSGVVSRFLDGLDAKDIEARVLSGGYAVHPVEAVIAALKEIANGRS